MRDDLMDALAAFAVGVITSTVTMLLFAVLAPEMSWNEIIGKIALQSVPASIGAMLGSKQLGGDEVSGSDEAEKREASYAGELFLMLVGALRLPSSAPPAHRARRGRRRGVPALSRTNGRTRSNAPRRTRQVPR
ncbi:DUF2391 family protein [uncultured Enterovirga sp.]|uniref:DUF2391 family protein n=1 Tax=uncultured Enterovirga sp. TaxID=2026352 RepID=UPI0035CBB8F1